jgi:hemoglobin-like flavoprotein
MTKPSAASTSRAPSKAQVKAAELWLLDIGEEQAGMVKAGWQAAVDAPGDFGSDFYRALFTVAPGVIGLFSGDMTEQQGRLTHTLAETVELVDQPATLLLLLRASGVRHHHYEVKHAYFSVMRDTLINTIATRAGALFDAPHRQAWEAMFDNMAVIMQDGMASAAK